MGGWFGCREAVPPNTSGGMHSLPNNYPATQAGGFGGFDRTPLEA